MPKGVYPRDTSPECSVEGCTQPKQAYPALGQVRTLCRDHVNEQRRANHDPARAHEYHERWLAKPGKREKMREVWRINSVRTGPERRARYRAKPESRDRERAYAEEYNARPEVQERVRARQKIYNQRPEVKARNRIHSQSPKSKMRKREYMQRRQGRILDVQFLVKQETDVCGVCLLPLTADKWPAPLATTVGHEPPLARAAKDGWLTVIERPEHWACNRRKRDLLDSELRAA